MGARLLGALFEYARRRVLELTRMLYTFSEQYETSGFPGCSYCLLAEYNPLRVRTRPPFHPSWMCMTPLVVIPVSPPEVPHLKKVGAFWSL